MRSWRRSCPRPLSNSIAPLDRLIGEPAFEGYHLLPSVRGDLLHKLRRCDEARAAFEAAAALAGNRRELDLLRRRAAEAADAAMSQELMHALMIASDPAIHSGRVLINARRPVSGVERTCSKAAGTSPFDPGCVKTPPMI
jgi:hypothetical protein